MLFFLDIKIWYIYSNIYDYLLNTILKLEVLASFFNEL